jgi:hypothetical protein
VRSGRRPPSRPAGAGGCCRLALAGQPKGLGPVGAACTLRAMAVRWHPAAALLAAAAAHCILVRVTLAVQLESVALSACLQAAQEAAHGEATTCILAAGEHAAATSGPTPVVHLRGPLTIIGGAAAAAAGSGSGARPSLLRGAAPIASTGWSLDPSSGGRPIFVTTLPEQLRRSSSGRPISCVFVDDVFVSEARWPNANISNILSLHTWALTSNASSLGHVVDSPLGPASVGGQSGLAASGVDWTGARATLNIGDRFTTYVRLVKNHSAGSDAFDYSPQLGKGPGAPAQGNAKWGAGARYWLAGKKAALDSAGEWYLDAQTHQLSIWTPDGKPPAGRVSVRTQDYCVDVVAQGQPFVLQDVHMHSCTFRLRGCDRCAVSRVNISYASYDPTIQLRNTPPGPLPNVRALERRMIL